MDFGDMIFTAVMEAAVFTIRFIILVIRAVVNLSQPEDDYNG